MAHSAQKAGAERFPVASLLLPKAMRRKVLAFYGFARQADDIADDPALSADEKRARLAALSPPDAHAAQLMQAFLWDVTWERAAGWQELLDYCRLSAVPVGRFLLELAGEGAECEAPADALCTVLQIFNHLADCGQDYRRLNRVYFPWEPVEDLAADRSSPALRRQIDEALERARPLLELSRGLPGLIRHRGLRAQAALTVAMAQAQAEELALHDPLAGRLRLSWRRWPVLLWRALRLYRGRVVGSPRSSFSIAMRFLALPRRRAMYALYAYCRVVDDIADDGDALPAERLAALDEWRDRIERLYAGRPDHAVTCALYPAVAAYGLEKVDFLAVLDGMAMDAEGRMLRPSRAELDLYCDRVASAVGRSSVRVFGACAERGRLVAHHLGRALQLTNILRDLAEDAGLGRLYLPDDLLAEAGIVGTDILDHPRLTQVCAALGAEAREHFHQAKAAMTHCDNKAMLPARLMGAAYEALLDRLEQAGWPTRQRVRMPLMQKLTIVARVYLSSLMR